MKRKKTSPDFESIRREIARRLQAGLPLAGMIAATTLLCGCRERAGRVPEGSVPRDPSLYEQQTETKPKAQNQPKNQKNETESDVPAGDVEPPPNRNNETCDPASVMGRYPAKPKNKERR